LILEKAVHHRGRRGRIPGSCVSAFTEMERAYTCMTH
jgi:hypothetical protein